MMLQGMTVSHCLRLATLWTLWLEPKGPEERLFTGGFAS
jgi:hypothetical protein